MFRVFQIGFHVCGTRSLAVFFQQNNFFIFHHENGKLSNQLVKNLKNGKTKFDKNYEGPFLSSEQGVFYGALQGEETVKPWDKEESYKLFKEIDISYPNSLFLLNTRNDWVASKMKKLRANNYLYQLRDQGISKSQLAAWFTEDEKQHYDNVREYFNGRKEFLEFNIQTEKIEKVSEWLKEHGVKIYTEKFFKIRG